MRESGSSSRIAVSRCVHAHARIQEFLLAAAVTGLPQRSSAHVSRGPAALVRGLLGGDNP